MKTRIFIQSAICILAAASVSCTKEENGTEPSSKFEAFSVNAISEDATKTQLTNGNTVIWLAGDDVSAFSVNASSHKNNKLSCTSASGTSATFSGEIEDGTTSFLLVYPYNVNTSYNGTTISNAVIPETQTATAGSFANGASLGLAAGTKTPGKPECSAGTFKNLCAVLSFTLPSNITFAKEITISSKTSTPMAGTVTVDGANQAITSATATSVKLTGSFTGGSTYYVAVAPGTHSSGFSFTIKTNGGNTYLRETTKDITAAAGKIYPLGTLSLALPQDALSTSVSISHDVASGTLNGSTAKFTLTNNKSEFAGLVTKYKAVVNLKSGSTVVRTLTNEGTSISNVSMSIANGYYYLPQGSYAYEATITYTVNNGTKDVTRELKYSGSATSPQPSGFSLDANLSGYTSYSVYKGTDGQTASASNANNFDNATIYGIGASYKSGLSSNVYNQVKNNTSLFTISSTLDGSAKSGNQGSQSWAAHTIGAAWSFDGASGTCSSTKAVYVTGLPYRVSSFSSDGNNAKDSKSNSWVRKGANNSVQNNGLRCGGTTGTNTTTAWGTNFSFFVPANINVTLYCPNTQIYTYTVVNVPTFTAKIAGSQVISEKGNESRKSTKTVSPSGNGTITSSNSEIYIASDRWAAGPYVEVYNVQLTYR